MLLVSTAGIFAHPQIALSCYARWYLDCTVVQRRISAKIKYSLDPDFAKMSMIKIRLCFDNGGKFTGVFKVSLRL